MIKNTKSFQLNKISFKLRKRRGVAEIIGTMMLMAITVVGASILTYFVNDSFASGNMASTSVQTTSKQIKLNAYDARDSTTLLQISGVDNKFGDQKLCGVGCAANTNKRPTTPIFGGTEFVVLQFTNNSLNPIYLHGLQINYVVHDWDSQQAGNTLNFVADLPIGSYPADGKFSILKTSSSVQTATNQIQSGETVNLLVKLGPTVPDISLNKVFRVLLNIGNPQPVEFLLVSGSVV